MSLLGDLGKKVLGEITGGGQPSQQGGISASSLSSLLPLIPTLLQSIGGIEGLMSKFKSAGLGDKIAGWVSTGPNPPATADDIRAALGGHVDQVAQETGQAPDDVAGGLASLLPGLIDKLTPKGEVPPVEEQKSGLEGLLSGGAAGLLGKLLG